MLNQKKICVVLPAYNASETLEMTYREIPFDIVDMVVLVDDASRDDTAEVGRKLGISNVIRHEKNRGYGGNQKSCYNKALELGADIIVMLHPDYQYTPKLIHAMVSVIAYEVYPVTMGSRILGRGAIKGGMPIYKYIGYRAFSKEIFEKINIELNSDDFVFDNQMLAQIFYAGYEIGEVTCPTKYFEEASSINFSRSVKYGLGVVGVSIGYRFAKWGLFIPSIYKTK